MDDLQVGDKVTVRWTGVEPYEITPPEFVVIAAVLPDGRYRLQHNHPGAKFNRPVSRDQLRKGLVS